MAIKALNRRTVLRGLLATGAGITVPAVHLLLALAAILFVRGWALTR